MLGLACEVVTYLGGHSSHILCLSVLTAWPLRDVLSISAALLDALEMLCGLDAVLLCSQWLGWWCWFRCCTLDGRSHFALDAVLFITPYSFCTCQCLHGSFSHAQCCLLMASVWLLCAVDAVLFLVEPVLCCFCAIYAGVLLMLCSSWWSLFCASSVPFMLCSRAASVVSFSLTLTSLERGILGLVLCT